MCPIGWSQLVASISEYLFTSCKCGLSVVKSVLLPLNNLKLKSSYALLVLS